MVNIIRTKADNEVFHELIKELDKDLHGNNYEAQNQYDSLNKIPIDAHVVLCFDDYRAIGCGCIKVIDYEVVEVKRMYIKKDERGKGLSKLIIKELEKWANEIGMKKMILETGIKQIEAIGLYKGMGFSEIEKYGEYKGMTTSICMGKSIK